MEAAIVGVFGVLIGIYIRYSFKILDQGQTALVERFGKYQKTMEPGINIVLPGLDRIALVQSSREQVVEIPPQPCTTSDSVSVNVSGVMYWQITDLKNARYNIENVDKSLLLTFAAQIQTQIGRSDLDHLIGGQARINEEILQGMSNDTQNWGVKILRVRLGEITIPQSVLQSMEKQKAAEIERKAMVSRSEGEKTAEIMKAEAEAKSNQLLAESKRKVRQEESEAIAVSIERIANAIASHPQGQEAVQYLLAQKYLEMGQTIGQSPSSKILFMDPQSIPGAIQSLLAMSDNQIAEKITEIIPDVKQPFGASSNIPPSESDPSNS